MEARFGTRGAIDSMVSRALPTTCSTVSCVVLTDSLSVFLTFEILELRATTSSVWSGMLTGSRSGARHTWS